MAEHFVEGDALFGVDDEDPAEEVPEILLVLLVLELEMLLVLEDVVPVAAFFFDFLLDVQGCVRRKVHLKGYSPNKV